MPLPLTVSCFSKIQIGFSFLVPAHLGSPGERAVKRVYFIYFGDDIPNIFYYCVNRSCLQCFDTVGWVAGRASGLQKTEQWGAGMVICLERGADLHMSN